MKKILNLYIVLVVFACLCHATDTYLRRKIDRLIPTPMVNIQDVIDRAMKAVVYVRVNGEEGWGGSGVYVGKGLIMTARHIVKDGESFSVTFENGNEYLSCCAMFDPDVDVGFIFISEPDCIPLGFSTEKSRRGDTVYLLGNPYGLSLKFSVTRGIVSNTNREHDGLFGNKPVIQIDAGAYPGDSGGPVINEKGEIVAMNVATFGSGDNTNACIPADVCRQALESRRTVQEFK